MSGEICQETSCSSFISLEALLLGPSNKISKCSSRNINDVAPGGKKTSREE